MGYVLTSADVDERVEARLAVIRANRPHIVTICGSTRFKDEIHAAKLVEQFIKERGPVSAEVRKALYDQANELGMLRKVKKR